MDRRVYGLTFDDLDERYFERDAESGKVVTRLAGAMEIRDDGIAPRVDGETLVETQASPVALRSAVSPSDARAIDRRITTAGETASARLTAAIATRASTSHTHAETDLIPNVIKLTPHASGVNGVEIQEAPTLFGPNITPYGSDTDIRLTLFGKGTEKVYVNGALPALGGQTILAAGTATLVGGTVTVSLATIAAGSIVVCCHKVFGGVAGLLSWTLIASTSFTITSANPLDTSDVSYLVVTP